MTTTAASDRLVFSCVLGCLSYYPVNSEGYCTKCQRDDEWED